jgi:hypothetical protein
MPNVYQQILARAREAYANASDGFLPESAANEITAALDGFAGPLAEIAEAIDGLTAGSLSPDAYATAKRTGLRLLQAQLTVLQTAIASAARATRRKVAGAALLDQAAYTRRAANQNAAQNQLLDLVTKLVGDVREDADAAAPGDGGSSDRLKPVDLRALRESLEHRAAPKEDRLATEELRQISGQRSQSQS